MSSFDRRSFLARTTAYSAVVAVPSIFMPDRANAFFWGFLIRPAVQQLARWGAGVFYRNTVGPSMVRLSNTYRSGSLAQRTVRGSNKLAEEGFKKTAEWKAGKILDKSLSNRTETSRRPVELATVEAVNRNSRGQSCWAHCSTLGAVNRPVLAHNPDMLAMGLASRELQRGGHSEAAISRMLYPREKISSVDRSNAQNGRERRLAYSTASGIFVAETTMSRDGNSASLIGSLRAPGQASSHNQTWEWNLLPNGTVREVGISVSGSRRRSKRLRDRRGWKCENWQDRLYYKEWCE